MKIFHQKRGFTLVELLVVVAIIALLAGIVLANVNTARNKAKNNTIKENLYSLKLAAELAYDENDSYEAICTETGDSPANDIGSSGNFLRIRTAINSQGGTIRLCHDDASYWCAQVTDMPYNDEDWCADGTGYAGSDDYCDGTNFTCEND